MLCCLLSGAVFCQPVYSQAQSPETSGAGSGADHDRARAAVERGEILDLEQILNIAQRDFRASFVDVDLRQTSAGERRYLLRMLSAEGSVLELEYRASDGVLLEIRGHAIERALEAGGTGLSGKP